MTFKTKARRAGWLLIIAAFAFGLVSVVHPPSASAYGLISSRYIKMSSSANGATNTIYSVGFTTATTASIGAIVVQFCSNNPIIGDTCSTPTTAPNGPFLNTNYATTGLYNWSTTGGTTIPPSTFTINTTTSKSNFIMLTAASPYAINTNTTITFDLGNGTTNGFTNPQTTNLTFFARITLYNINNPDFSTDTNMQTTEKDATKLVDAGGVALSTAAVLNVTAKVQEALTFCVYTQADCATGGSAVKLGDTNNVLAATNVYYTDATPKFDLASNALGGVVVRLKGPTLTSGTFTITSQGDAGSGGSYGCVQDSTSTSVEQFGVRVVTYGTGQAAPTSPSGFGTQNDFGCNAGYHKFNDTLTNTTYGQPFVATTGATDKSTTNFEIGAKAANTTEAGVYTTNLQLIATATY